jgi:uncharacterized membrane protein
MAASSSGFFGSAGRTVGRPYTLHDPAAEIRATVTVATYPDYEDAQLAVDFLSDQHFPVERISVVGTDLRLVENVLGRVTVGRAALAGAAGGAWFGLFIGLLFGLFGRYDWFAVVATGIVAGAVWGAVFGAVAHAATGGRRDFSSRGGALVTLTYDVVVEPEYAEQARQLLARLPWPLGDQTYRSSK